MRRAQDVRKQLITLMDRHQMDVVSCGKNLNRVRQALVAGFFTKIAVKDTQTHDYKTLVGGTVCSLHPSSSLFGKSPQWVLYHELVTTTKEYMREVTQIDPRWLSMMAPNFYKLADGKTMSKRKRGEKLQELHDPKAEAQPGGIQAWRVSKRRG